MKRKIEPAIVHRYTVMLKLNREAAFPRMEWSALRGHIEDGNPRLNNSEFTHRTIAGTADEAILQARQKQGLEALLQRINKGKENA